MEMDADYARLSLLAGYFARGADDALGEEHFIPLVRANAWQLTEAMLAEWKAQAVSMGVPIAVLEPTPEQERLIPSLIALGLKRQEEIDSVLAKDGLAV